MEVPAEIIETALALELQDGEFIAESVDGERCVFLAELHCAERASAMRIKTLSGGALPWPAIDAAKAIPWVETRAGITLAANRREAVQLALATKVLVITGGPGVGKITLVNSILKILSVKGVRIALAAPTCRAAKRLSESTCLEAKSCSPTRRPSTRARAPNTRRRHSADHPALSDAAAEPALAPGC